MRTCLTRKSSTKKNIKSFHMASNRQRSSVSTEDLFYLTAAKIRKNQASANIFRPQSMYFVLKSQYYFIIYSNCKYFFSSNYCLGIISNFQPSPMFARLSALFFLFAIIKQHQIWFVFGRIRLYFYIVDRKKDIR